MPGVAAGEWNVVGHEWAVQFLQGALARGNPSHAYLFIGPPQVGKRTLATEFARSINCTGEKPPCGSCRSCELVLRGSHSDVATVRGEGVHRTLLIDQVHAMRREANLTPLEGRRRIYIVCGMELANVHAANALLKVLEEPPAHVTFLLTAVAEELVAPTIVSRCQVLPLRPLSRETIAEALRVSWGVEPEQAALLSRLSGGRMGRALTLLQSEPLLLRRQAALEQLQNVLAAHWGQRFDVAAELARRTEQIPEVLEVWLSWWRDLFLAHEGLGDRITNLDRRGELDARRGAFTPAQMRSTLSALQECSDHLQTNVSPRLALERLMLHLPSAGELKG
jgi:DNA polymerase III subunit delta'